VAVSLCCRIVEDRCPPGLWLEMTDAYVDQRRAELVAQTGVLTSTWWVNACRDRTDLPRRLPEFDVLGVCEVDESFEPPCPRRGSTGYHFVRTGRPGQGVLTGRPTIGLLIVLISARSDDSRQDLRDWADFVHIRHIAAAAVPGYGMITPYVRAAGATPHFLHLYEIDRDDPEAVFQAMTPLVEARLGPPGTPAWDTWARHPALRIEYVNTFRRLDGA
jgi:hypothetical protein